MRAMKDSGVEWIGEIPQDWNIVPNKHIMHREKRICDKWTGQDVMSLTMNGVIVRDLINPVGKMPLTFDGYQYVHAGELLMCLFDIDVTPRCVGRVLHNGVTSPAYSCFILHNGANLNYYYYYYLMLDNTKELLHLARNLRHSFTETELGVLKIPQPPLSEQQRIADFLDEKCADIDTAISEAKASIEDYKLLKQSIITRAVTKGLNPNAEMKDSGIEWIGGVPKDWNLEKGKHLFVQRRERGNNIELQLLSPTQNFGVIPQTMYEECSGYKAVKIAEGTDLTQFKTIHKGDFCISLRSFQGGFEYSEYEGVVSPAYQVFYAIKPVCDKYYNHLFKDKSFIEKMNSYTMTLRDGKNIAFADFANTIIPFPPISEQNEIAEYIDDKCSKIDALVSEKEQIISELEAYKKSLIFEYVTGKKEVA